MSQWRTLTRVSCAATNVPDSVKVHRASDGHERGVPPRFTYGHRHQHYQKHGAELWSASQYDSESLKLSEMELNSTDMIHKQTEWGCLSVALFRLQTPIVFIPRKGEAKHFCHSREAIHQEADHPVLGCAQQPTVISLRREALKILVHLRCLI